MIDFHDHKFGDDIQRHTVCIGFRIYRIRHRLPFRKNLHRKPIRHYMYVGIFGIFQRNFANMRQRQFVFLRAVNPLARLRTIENEKTVLYLDFCRFRIALFYFQRELFYALSFNYKFTDFPFRFDRPRKIPFFKALVFGTVHRRIHARRTNLRKKRRAYRVFRHAPACVIFRSAPKPRDGGTRSTAAVL